MRRGNNQSDSLAVRQSSSWAVCDDCVFVVARTVPIISSNNGRQRSHIVGHVCLIFATIASSWLLLPLLPLLLLLLLLLSRRCNCSNRPPTASFPLLFLPVSFSSNYLANKQASNWTEAGNELCCPAGPEGNHSLSLSNSLHAHSTGPAYLQSPAASEALFHVHGSASFSIFCCSGAAALLSLRFRFTFYVLRFTFFIRPPTPLAHLLVPGPDFVVVPNFSCASPFDLRWFLLSVSCSVRVSESFKGFCFPLLFFSSILFC